MPYFAVKDANGDIIYVAATGAGTTGDPYVPTRTFTNSIPAGTAVIGKVDQGTGGASAWKVDGSGVTQPVSAASLPLPTGAATAANQTTANASLGSIDGKLPAQGQALAAASLPVVLPAAQITTLTPPAAITGFATETTLAGVLTQSDFDTKVGALTETAPATDTASSGLNGRAQRIAQNITSLIAKLPAALGQTTKSASLPVVLPSDYLAPIVSSSVAPTVTSVSANNADMVASMSAVGYQSATVQLTSVGGGATVNLQCSNDNTTWFTLNFNATGANAVAFASGMSVTNALYEFVIPPCLFIRMRTTAWTSGTISGVLVLSSLPIARTAYAATPQASGGQMLTNIPGDGAGMSYQALTVDAMGSAYNGSTRDRVRNVGALSVLASSARTTDTSSSDQTNYNWRGMALTLNVSAQSGGSVKLALQIKDSISGNYATVWTATAAQTAVGTYTYLLCPGALDAASWTEKVQLALAMRTWRITTTTANGSSITYSVSADMLL